VLRLQDRKFWWNFRWYFWCLSGSSGQPDRNYRLDCERCARIWENTSVVWPEVPVHDQKFRSTTGSSGPWTEVRIGAFVHALTCQDSLPMSDWKFRWNFRWVRVSHNGQICLATTVRSTWTEAPTVRSGQTGSSGPRHRNFWYHTISTRSLCFWQENSNITHFLTSGDSSKE